MDIDFWCYFSKVKKKQFYNQTNTVFAMALILNFDFRIPNLTMESPHDDNNVELQNVTVVTPESPHSHGNPSFSMDMENGKGPPPYLGPGGGGQGHRNGHLIQAIDGRDTPRSSSPGPEFISNGDVIKSDSHLSVKSDTRKRHKSEGATPSSTPGKSFLDPNNRKGSIYESKSTLSGARFDDSFIGKYI